MPETNDGAAVEVTDKAAPSSDATNPLPGFAETMLGFPPESPAGQPEPAKAVETNATEKVAEVEAVKPETAPVKTEAEPAPASTVNFDGLSDESKTFWDKALKEGHATAENVETAKRESLFAKFQPIWSRRNQEIADARKAFAAEMEQRKADLALLDSIRGDEQKHKAWLRMSSGDVPAEDPAGGDTDDTWKRVEKTAQAVYDKRKAEEAARSAKEQAEYKQDEAEVSVSLNEAMSLLKVDRPTMLAYLREEEAALKGADPIIRYGKNPTALVEKIQTRHEKALLAARVKELEGQLSQRASKAVQTSKQSLQPTRRDSEAEPKGLAKVMRDVGVGRLTDIAGFGWGPDGPPSNGR